MCSFTAGEFNIKKLCSQPESVCSVAGELNICSQPVIVCSLATGEFNICSQPVSVCSFANGGFNIFNMCYSFATGEEK